MNTKYSKALIMSGKDYQLTDSIILHHPTVGEVLSINKTPTPDYSYWTYLQIMLSDPYTNMVMLDDMGKNYLEVSSYEVFIYQWDNCLEEYKNNKELYDSYGLNPLNDIMDALNFFINGKHIFAKGNYDDGSICFYDINDNTCQINQEIYEYIYDWIKSINKIDYSGRIKPADENARRILIEDMRDEIKKAKRRRKKEKKDEDSDYFGSLMSANCFCGNSSITPFNINDCKLYWINEALSIISKKSNADHILDGIYHGTLSSKDINKKELDWIK